MRAPSRLAARLKSLLTLLGVTLPIGGCYLYHTALGPTVPTDFNVVFVTLDGVRWQEFFHGSDPQLTPRPEPLFVEFWRTLAPRGTVWGDERIGSEATVANGASVSLPAYMNIFAGSAQPCAMNDCSRIQANTLVDRLSDDLGFEPRDIAAFASWRQIALALTSRDDIATINVSQMPFDDGSGDPELSRINQAQVSHYPSWGVPCAPGTPGPDALRPCADTRWDEYTWAHAMRYLVRHQPRFLYISLNDSDSYGHEGDYPGYVRSLKTYDEWLVELFETLDSMGDYGRNTAVIVTTDHGRGNWDQWPWHGFAWPSSNKIWFYMKLPEAAADWNVSAPSRSLITHSDIRPTIETLFGLGTRECSGCGRPLARPEEGSAP